MEDNRDWLSTQTRRCDECGFDGSALTHDQIPGAIVAVASQWRDAVLAANPAVIRIRPDPTVWAPLEYACHVRDVLAVFTGRVVRMLATDGTALGWWDHEAAPAATAYLKQDPVVVADSIYASGCGLAAVTRRVPDDDWERTAVRRSGEEFTLAGLLRFGLHEANHHLRDFAAGS